MIREFRPFGAVDTEAMTAYVESMLEVLELLNEGSIPSVAYTLADLDKYLRSLVDGQRGSLSRTIPGNWGVVPDDKGMPADARVDFIFQPTYIATATLARALCEYPLTALSIRGYAEALRSGMDFCSTRELQGHGYEGDDGAILALQILSMGKIPWLLNRHPDCSPELKAAIDAVAEDMAARLESGNARGVWGEDYSEGFRSALETMHILNEPGFIADLAQAREHPATATRDALEW